MLFSLCDVHLPVGLAGIVLPVGLAGIFLVVGLAEVGLAAVLLVDGGRVMLWSCFGKLWGENTPADGDFLFCFKFCTGSEPLQFGEAFSLKK
jgi:hypothetical protein